MTIKRHWRWKIWNTNKQWTSYYCKYNKI